MSETSCDGGGGSIDPALANLFQGLGSTLVAMGETIGPQFSEVGTKLAEMAISGSIDQDAGGLSAKGDGAGLSFGEAISASGSTPGFNPAAGPDGSPEQGYEASGDNGIDHRLEQEQSVTEGIKSLWTDLGKSIGLINEDRVGAEAEVWNSLLRDATAGVGKIKAVQKGMAIASVIMDTERSVSNALASKPFPFNLPLAALMAAKGAASLSKVKGVFHDGIVDVPSTGTYLLEQGERVVDRRLNADLKGFLRGQGAGQGPMSGSVNAPAALPTSQTFAPQITVNGNADQSTLDQLEQRLRDLYAERFETGFV